MPATAVGSAKGEIDQRIEIAPARKWLTHKNPGNDQTEQTIDDRGQSRGAKGQLICGDDDRIGNRRDELGPRQLRGLEDQRRERDQHQQREIEERIAERQPEAGDDLARARHSSNSRKTQADGRRVQYSRPPFSRRVSRPQSHRLMPKQRRSPYFVGL